jgi:hypothetical protein
VAPAREAPAAAGSEAVALAAGAAE